VITIKWSIRICCHYILLSIETIKKDLQLGKIYTVSLKIGNSVLLKYLYLPIYRSVWRQTYCDAIDETISSVLEVLTYIATSITTRTSDSMRYKR